MDRADLSLVSDTILDKVAVMKILTERMQTRSIDTAEINEIKKQSIKSILDNINSIAVELDNFTKYVFELL